MSQHSPTMALTPDAHLAVALADVAAFAVLTAACLLLTLRQREETGPGWWCAAFAAGGGTALLAVMPPPLDAAATRFLGDSLEAAFVVLLLTGVVRFQGLRTDPRLLGGLLAGQVMWSALALLAGFGPLLRTLPLAVVGGGIAAFAGWLTIRQAGEARRPATVTTGLALLLWGLHRVDRPLLADGAWSLESAALAHGLLLAFGLGLVVVILRRRGQRAVTSEFEASRARAQILSILEASPIGVVVAQPEDGRVLYANSRLAQLTGATVEPGTPKALDPKLSVDPTAMKRVLESIGDAEHAHNVELSFRRLDGGSADFLVTAGPITFNGQRALLTWLYDITDRKRLEDELRRLATTDSLTGAYNRRSFMDLSQKETQRARRYERPLSVLLMDVDRFKGVNDTYGHAAGDQVLVMLTRRCQQMLRAQDVLGRIGGEEFAIVLPETDLPTAAAVAERLRVMVAESVIEHAAGAFNVTVSIGVAQCRTDQEAFEECLSRADKALYEAKAKGRNRVIVA